MGRYADWQAVLDQNAGEMEQYFQEHARFFDITPRNAFTKQAFLRANCATPEPGPGDATGGGTGDAPITVAHVYARNELCSFHVTSFFRISREGLSLWTNAGRRWPAAPVAAGDGPQHADGETSAM